LEDAAGGLARVRMSGAWMDRRAFVRTSAAMLAGADLLRAMGRGQDALRIGLVAPAGDAAVASMARGVGMGVGEAAHTAALMGRRIELVRAGGQGAAAEVLAAAEALAREGGVAALIGGGDEASCRALGDVAESAGVLFINTGCAADAMRAQCRRNVFHVQASDAMYAAALAARPADAADATAAVLWHPSLERFGAGQVNDRFRAEFGGAGMDGAAWAGWMAVKVLWEASLRTRSTQAGALREYLERAGTQFDGHKGWPLSFRPWDHQLRQPLYLVAPAEGGATRVVAEVPARPAEGASSSRELLDALGGAATASGACASATG
jgi:ABC-type branched-subunit amino acid transport system substrate-binding protein